MRNLQGNVVAFFAAGLLTAASCAVKADLTNIAHGSPVTQAHTLPALQTGQVKVINNNGGSLVSGQVKVISNNGGSLIGNTGGGVVSNRTGQLISDLGGGLISRTRFELLQASGLAEVALADASVILVDANGTPFTDQAGRPITTTTDDSGKYSLAVTLPPHNAVLKIALANTGVLHGGELSALLVPQGAKPVDQPIDTSTSLGAAYVLAQYVHGSQATLDKLPASAASALDQDLNDAKALVTAVPDYQSDVLVALTDHLRNAAPAVSSELDVIRDLLLGQAAGGDGRLATTAALYKPRGLALDVHGALVVGEPVFGRVRSISLDGKIVTLVDARRGVVKQNYPDFKDLACGPDGTLYLATADGVVAIASDHSITTLAPQLAAGCLLVTADRTLYLGTKGAVDGPRVTVVGPTGAVSPAKLPADWAPGAVLGLAPAPEGGLFILCEPKDGRYTATLYKAALDGSAPVAIARDLKVNALGAGLASGPDGTAYVSESTTHSVLAFGPDGVRRTLAGAAGPAATHALQLPSSLVREADGTLLIDDVGTGQIFGLAPDGSWRLVAGTLNAQQEGSGGLEDLALNAPFGAAFDAQGRLLVSERGSYQVSRFDGQAFTTIAGGAIGSGGDGGPAKDAQFASPSGLAVGGGVLYVTDGKSDRLRKIDAGGMISSAVGGVYNIRTLKKGQPVGADQYICRCSNVAVGSDGTLYFSNEDQCQVARLTHDGQVLLVAGAANGFGGLISLGPSLEGGPAADASLSSPRGMAFGADGDLYVATLYDSKIHRIHDPGGATPTMTTHVGVAGALAYPTSLAMDAHGNLYVGEVGSTGLSLLGTLFGGTVLPGMGSPTYARVSKVAPDGTVTRVAGPSTRFFADPNADDALLLPMGLAIGPDGSLVIVDTGANLVRILPPGTF